MGGFELNVTKLLQQMEGEYPATPPPCHPTPPYHILPYPTILPSHDRCQAPPRTRDPSRGWTTARNRQ